MKTDLEGNYTYVNDYFCRRLGVVRQEVLGTSSFSQIIPEDHEKCIDVVNRCFANPETAQHVILRKPSPKGGYFSNECFFTLRTDEQGTLSEFICTGYDISLHNFQLLYEKAPVM